MFILKIRTSENKFSLKMSLVLDRLFRKRYTKPTEMWSTLPITDHNGRIYCYDEETDKLKPVRTSKRFKVLKCNFPSRYDRKEFKYYSIGLDYTGQLLVYDTKSLAEHGVLSTESDVLEFLESGRSIEVLNDMKIVDIGPKGRSGYLFWAINEDGKIFALKILQGIKGTTGIGSLLPEGEIAIDSTGYDLILTKSGKVYTWFGDLIPSPPDVKFVKIIKDNPAIVLVTRDGKMYIGEKTQTQTLKLDEEAEPFFKSPRGLVKAHINIPEKIVPMPTTERFLPIRNSDFSHSRFLAKSGKVFSVNYYEGGLNEWDELGPVGNVKQIAFRQAFFDTMGKRDIVLLTDDGKMFEFRRKADERLVLLGQGVKRVFDRCLYYQGFDGSLKLFSKDPHYMDGFNINM